MREGERVGGRGGGGGGSKEEDAFSGSMGSGGRVVTTDGEVRDTGPPQGSELAHPAAGVAGYQVGEDRPMQQQGHRVAAPLSGRDPGALSDRLASPEGEGGATRGRESAASSDDQLRRLPSRRVSSQHLVPQEGGGEGEGGDGGMSSEAISDVQLRQHIFRSLVLPGMGSMRLLGPQLLSDDAQQLSALLQPDGLPGGQPAEHQNPNSQHTIASDVTTTTAVGAGAGDAGAVSVAAATSPPSPSPLVRRATEPPPATPASPLDVSRQQAVDVPLPGGTLPVAAVSHSASAAGGFRGGLSVQGSSTHSYTIVGDTDLGGIDVDSPLKALRSSTLTPHSSPLTVSLPPPIGSPPPPPQACI